MSGFFIVLFFLLFKTAQGLLGWYCLNYFELQYDLVVLIIYGGLTLFQFIFYIFQNTIRKKTPASNRPLFRHTSIVIFFMEMIILSTALYYLYVSEYPDNAVLSILYIGTMGMGLNVLFYSVHQALFSGVIKAAKLEFRRVSIFGTLLYLFFGFIVPAAYAFIKLVIFEQELKFYDIYLIGGYWGILFLALVLQFAHRVSRARKTVRQMDTFHPELELMKVTTLDGNEVGIIQSALSNLGKKFFEHKEHIVLYNNYLSANLRSQIAEFGLDLDGEEKNATVLTILYTLNETDISPSQHISINKDIIRIAGEYAEQYDAYPMICPGKLVMVFGVPYYYEHQKYHAIECAISIIGDIEVLQEEKNFKMEIHAGAFTGKVICGAIPAYGKNYQQLTVVGHVLEDSAKVAAISKRLNRKLLIDPVTLDQLQSKFYVEKSYKTKWNGNGEIVLHQLRI